MPVDGASNEDFVGRMGIVSGWGRLEYGENFFNPKWQAMQYEETLFL